MEQTCVMLWGERAASDLLAEDEAVGLYSGSDTAPAW